MESSIANQLGVGQQERLNEPPTLEEAVSRAGRGFSPNYRGNINLDRNRSANIPNSLNCSLFIVGLPPKLTAPELLRSIRDAGRVYATHINGPDPANGHFTSAAKVIFFERDAAARFYDRCQAVGGLSIPGHPEVGRVLWNRIRTGEQAGHRSRTRVLIVAGDPGVVNEAFLTAYFRSKLNFQIDEVIDHGGGPAGRAIVEYRFGSYRCQAESARMSLGYEFASARVQVWFGPDPCDRRDVRGNFQGTAL